jgi:hypothetical protein
MKGRKGRRDAESLRRERKDWSGEERTEERHERAQRGHSHENPGIWTPLSSSKPSAPPSLLTQLPEGNRGPI